MDEKKPWESKTILFNALVAILGVIASLGFMPSIHEWVQANAEIVMAGIGGLGILLRLVTKGKISIG